MQFTSLHDIIVRLSRARIMMLKKSDSSGSLKGSAGRANPSPYPLLNV